MAVVSAFFCSSRYSYAFGHTECRTTTGTGCVPAPTEEVIVLGKSHICGPIRSAYQTEYERECLPKYSDLDGGGVQSVAIQANDNDRKYILLKSKSCRISRYYLLYRFAFVSAALDGYCAVVATGECPQPRASWTQTETRDSIYCNIRACVWYVYMFMACVPYLCHINVSIVGDTVCHWDGILCELANGSKNTCQGYINVCMYASRPAPIQWQSFSNNNEYNQHVKRAEWPTMCDRIIRNIL